MVGKKLVVGYCKTFIYKPSFHCSSKFVMNSSGSNTDLLPEEKKSLCFFGVCPTTSSYIQKNSDMEFIFNTLGIQDFFFFFIEVLFSM